MKLDHLLFPLRPRAGRGVLASAAVCRLADRVRADAVFCLPLRARWTFDPRTRRIACAWRVMPPAQTAPARLR